MPERLGTGADSFKRVLGCTRTVPRPAPFKPGPQVTTCVLNVNDTPTSRLERGRRRVEKQRTHQQRTAARYETHLFGYPGSPRGDLGIAKLTGPMRAGQHTKRSIVWTTGVEVEPDCQHSLQHFNWWLYVNDARLLAPGAIAWRLGPLRDCDREILMPSDFPVGDCCLVEEDSADGKRSWPEERIHEGANLGILGELSDFVNVEEIPQAAILTDRGWQGPLDLRDAL